MSDPRAEDAHPPVPAQICGNPIWALSQLIGALEAVEDTGQSTSWFEEKTIDALLLLDSLRHTAEWFQGKRCARCGAAPIEIVSGPGAAVTAAPAPANDPLPGLEERLSTN